MASSRPKIPVNAGRALRSQRRGGRGAHPLIGWTLAARHCQRSEAQSSGRRKERTTPSRALAGAQRSRGICALCFRSGAASSAGPGGKSGLLRFARDDGAGLIQRVCATSRAWAARCAPRASVGRLQPDHGERSEARLASAAKHSSGLLDGAAADAEAEDGGEFWRERAELIVERVRHVDRIKDAARRSRLSTVRRDRRERLGELRTGDGRPLGHIEGADRARTRPARIAARAAEGGRGAPATAQSPARHAEETTRIAPAGAQALGGRPANEPEGRR